MSSRISSMEGSRSRSSRSSRSSSISSGMSRNACRNAHGGGFDPEQRPTHPGHHRQGRQAPLPDSRWDFDRKGTVNGRQ